MRGPSGAGCVTMGTPVLVFALPSDIEPRRNGRQAVVRIEVHSRRESRVSDELAIRGLDFFLPTRRIKRRWSDRIKMLDVPLFPGYVFSRFDVADRLRVLNCPGVSRIVGAGSVPVPIEDGEMDAIKALVASKVALTPWPYLRTGQRVRLDHGPLAGLEGVGDSGAGG